MFISKSNADYVPNLTPRPRERHNLVIAVGFLMADAIAARSRSGSRRRSSRSSTSPASAELKGKPKNVRGLLFKEQEAGYLVGYLAALAAKTGPNSAA